MTPERIYYIINIMSIRLIKITLVILAFFLIALSLDEAFSDKRLTDDLILSIDKAKKETPPSKVLYRQYVDSGTYYLEQGLYQEAKDILWKAINLFPDDPDAYVNVAIVSLREKDFDSALRILEQAEGLASEDYAKKEILFYNLGLSHFMKKDYEKSTAYFLKALGVYPNFSEAMYYLGIAYARLDQKDKAFTNIFMAKHMFDKEGKIEYRDKANQFLQALVGEQQVDNISMSKTFLEEGKKSIAQNELDRAVILLEESIYLNPKYIDTYYELALLYSRKQAFHNAVGYLNRIIQIDPTYVKAYSALGYAYRELRNYEQAIGALEKACALDKENPVAYYDVATAYMEAMQFYTATKYLGEAKALALKKKDAALLEKINTAYAQCEKSQVPKHTLPHYPKVTKYKKSSENLYPYYATSGNKGFLNKGYFTVLPEAKLTDKDKKELDNVTSTTEY